MFSLILPLLILIIILVGAFVVIKKRWIDKKPTMCSAQFTAQNVFLQYQNQQRKKSIEHVLQQREERKQEDEGDDLERFFKS
jgi:uncharacterized protein (UPF0333 family)